MANPFDQFDQKQANPFDQFDQAGQPQSPQASQQEEVRRALYPTLKERITGETMMTPRIQSLPEIGNAPELSDLLSAPAFKASFGIMTTSNPQELSSILKTQFGDQVSFDQDEKGNVIVKFPSGEYALNKPGLSAQDIAQGALDVAAFTPAGRGTIPAVIGKSALTEAGLETVGSLTGGSFDVSDVALAAGIGGVTKGLEEGIVTAFRLTKGRVPQSQQELIDFAADEGIPLTTTDVFPPQTFAGKAAQETAEKVPFVGTGGVRETQQELREQAVNRIAEKYGEFSEKAIVDSLKSKKDKIKSAAGNVLEKAGNQLDQVGDIPLENTFTKIDEVMGELTKPGVIQSSKAIDDLSELLSTLKEAPQSYTTLKENRKAFREIVNSIDTAARSQLISKAKAQLKQVEAAMTKDMMDFAKQNLNPQDFSRLNKANAVYAREANKLTKSRLKSVLDKGDITPENVMPVLFSKKGSEVASLYKSLTTEGRNNARAAIISRVVDNVSKRAGGLTPDAFLNELKKYPAQTMAFFKGKDRKQLEGLMRVLESTQRAQKAAVTTPTGQATIGAGAGISAWVAPTETIGSLGTIGGLARLYESRPVRDALLKLSSVPRGSMKYEQALSEATQALNAAAQSLKEQEPGTEQQMQLEQ